MENNILKKISKLIIDKRLIVFIAFAAACVYCAMSIGRVKVNDDITAFLPRKAESRPNKQNTAYDNAPPDENPKGQ